MSLPNTFVVTGDAVMQLTCSGMHGGCRLLAQRSLRRGPNRRVQAMVGLRRIACGAAFCAFAFWTQDADAATAAVDGTILETAALGDGGAERCMVRVDASLPAAGLDCDGDWVAFDCWAERGAVPGGDRMRASLRLALAAGKRVELLVADDAADGVCRAEWIKVQDETDEDADADGDGVANLVDDLPLDPSSAADLDGDGQGDEVDIDDDGDGIPDTDDPAPRLRNEAPLVPRGGGMAVCFEGEEHAQRRFLFEGNGFRLVNGTVTEVPSLESPSLVGIRFYGPLGYANSMMSDGLSVSAQLGVDDFVVAEHVCRDG